MFYKDANMLSWPIYRTQAYFDTDATYTIEYYCDAKASAELDDYARRVKRVRKVTATGKLFDVTWAINTIYAKRSDYNKGTPDFIFKATDLAYVSALTYNDN